MADSAEQRKRGILWMLATSFCFIMLDSMMKYLMQELPLVEVTWARFFFGTIFPIALAGRQLPKLMRSHAPGAQTLRSVFLMATTGAFNAGIRTTPLATATTIMFLSPILVTMLSIPLLGERVGLRRWISIFVGFLGALIVVQPWEGGFTGIGVGVLMLLLAALLNANYQILTRKVRADDPLTSLLFTALAGAIVTSLIVPFYWVNPNFIQWLLMAGCGVAGGLGHFCLIRAFRLAPASVVAPFGYSSLVWAIIFGALIWNDWPAMNTLVGAALIVGAGIYIFNREQRLKMLSDAEARKVAP